MGLLLVVIGDAAESVSETQYVVWNADGVIVIESWVPPEESVLNGVPVHDPEEYHFTMYGEAPPPFQDAERVTALPS
jgi:hypothetical protein